MNSFGIPESKESSYGLFSPASAYSVDINGNVQARLEEYNTIIRLIGGFVAVKAIVSEQYVFTLPFRPTVGRYLTAINASTGEVQRGFCNTNGEVFWYGAEVTPPEEASYDAVSIVK